MSVTIKIPKHWQLKKLGDVCHTTSGGTPSRQKSSYYIGNIPWVKSGELDKGLILDTEEKISEEAVKNSSAKIFPKGTLLIALYGATIGKLAFLGVDAATNQAICGIFKNENIDSSYLYHFLFYKKPNLVKQGIGGAQPNINQGILKNLDLPIPPLPEQHQIVAKIEELFSELENGKQQLQIAQQQLKVYRQSLLKFAFEGRLTNKYVKEGELPKGWKWVKLSDLGSWKGGGTPSKQVNKYWENGNNLWVTSKDMKIGVINDSINKITDEAILNSSANRIPKGAILFVMRSGILRHTFPVAIAGKELTVNQDLQTLNPNGLATSEFIYWFIRAFNNEIRQKCSKDGTTVESIESNTLKSYQFILPPLKEQQHIVEELESKLTVCDKIAETISQSLQQAETLRQSILKKAFEGKLI
jgi:type I restriction enzyme S subunit